MPKHEASSNAAMVRAARNVQQPDIELPSHCTLTDAAKPYWVGIIRARARDEWTDADLVIAAQLAQLQSDIEQEQARLRHEGRVIVVESSQGVRTAVNPRVSVIRGLSATQQSLRTTLRMGVYAAQNTTGAVAARKLEKAARITYTQSKSAPADSPQSLLM